MLTINNRMKKMNYLIFFLVIFFVTQCVRSQNAANPIFSALSSSLTPNITRVTPTAMDVSVTPIPTATLYSFTASSSSAGIIRRLESNTSSVIFNDLAEGHNYTVNCSVTHQDGVARGESVYQLTAPPNVQNHTVVMRESTNLTVAFNESRSATTYVMTITNSATTKTVVTNTTTTTITGLSPGTMHDISVTAINSAGESGESGRLIDGRTRSESPNFLFFTSIRDDLFTVSWPAQTGAVSYSVSVVYFSNGTVPRNVNVPATNVELSRTVTGLSPGTKYNVSVTTNDAFGSVTSGRLNTVITVPGRVENITVLSQTNTSITCQWTSVRSATDYRVDVRSATSVILRNQMVQGLSYTAENLPSGGLYTLSVAAANENGPGTISLVDSNTIAYPFPSEVSFVSNTNSSITIRHTTVIEVITYMVRATNQQTGHYFTTTSENQVCTFPNLISGINYDISVQGIYETGSSSEFGAAGSFSTKPATPENLRIIREDFSLTCTTDVVVGATSYWFIIFKSGTTVVQTHDQPRAEFTQLLSGQEYYFEVYVTRRTENRIFTSQNASITGKTTRAVPTDVRVTNVTHNQLRVTYSSISGAQSYDVRAIPLNNTLQTVSEPLVTGTSVILINLEASQAYNIDVRANYSTGIGNPSAAVLKYTAPLPPDDLRVTLVRNKSISISWVEESAAMSYTVVYNSSTTSLFSLNTTETQENIPNLEAGTVYTFTVTAFNMNLQSVASMTLIQITAPSTPSFRNKTSTQTSIFATWDQPKGTESYEVEVIQNGVSSIASRNILVAAIGYNSTDGIQAGSVYTVCISAGTKEDPTIVGIPQYSHRVCVDITTAPPDVQNLRIVQRLTTSLTLHFNHSQSATSYRVTWSNSSSSASLNVSSPTATLIGLSPGTMYNISVVAINDAGESGNSGMLVNEFTRSLSPNILTFEEITTTSFVVTWTEQVGAFSYVPSVVFKSNGLSSPTVLFPTNTNMRRITVTGLVPGTEYNVSITTSDKFGLTDSGSPNTELTLPGTVEDLYVLIQTNTSITCGWELVQSATYYRIVLRNMSGLVEENKTTTSLNYTSPPLKPGQIYMTSVAAGNRNGIGERLEKSETTIPYPFPAVALFSSNTNSSITVDHTLVPGPVSYTIRARLNQNSQELTCTTTNQSCTFNNLLSGTDYSFSVRGNYRSRDSSEYGRSEFFTTKPATPENPEVDALDFSLNVMTDSVVGATYYLYELNNRTVQSHDQSRARFLRLSSGRRYSIRVTAVRSTSYGDFSSETLLISEKTTRAIPINVRVSEVKPNAFDVLWSSIDGATSYEVTAFPTDASLPNISSTTNFEFVTLRNLVSSQLYTVTVRGVFSTGIGGYSLPVQQFTAPATPSGLTVTNVETTSITFSWRRVSTATSYRIHYTSSSTSLSVNTTSTQTTLRNLRPGFVYSITVVAINLEFESFPSDELKQITVPTRTNFLFTSQTQISISAMWSRPNGTVSYQVEVRQGARVVVAQRTITDSVKRFISNDGIETGSLYNICVRAVTSSNPSIVGTQQISEEQCTDITTNPGNTSLPMEVSTTATTLTVRWTASIGATSYSLRLVQMSNSSVIITRNTTLTMDTVPGLIPAEKYLVSVQAFNNLGGSDVRSGEVVIQTNPTEPTLTIANVQVNSFVVRWTIESAIRYSEVRVERTDGEAISTEIMIPDNGVISSNNVPQQNAVISNLDESTEYRVLIRTVTRLHKRSAVGQINHYTLPINPQNVTLVARNQSVLSIEWNPANTATAYFVEVFVEETNVLNSSQSVVQPRATFTSLSSSTNYTFNIKTLSIAGNSSISKFQVQTESSSTPPILSCPPSTSCNQNQAWVCQYIRWKIDFVFLWKKSFTEWSRCYNSPFNVTEIQCNLLDVSCINPYQRQSVELNGCQVYFCMDGLYQNIPDWIMDAWRNDEVVWREYYNVWYASTSQFDDGQCMSGDFKDTCA